MVDRHRMTKDRDYRKVVECVKANRDERKCSERGLYLGLVAIQYRTLSDETVEK